jgi:cytosine/adenosine deaminase-related metal-dependent hydrolase
LGAKTPNLARADVLIDGDRIAEVGQGLRARDAEVIEATDAIVMPGFVDTHRHAWRSLFRNLGDPASAALGGDGVGAVGELYRPDDLYAATLLSLLAAVEAGITTVVDRADLAVDATSSEAVLRAHADAGVRTVFVHVPRRTGDDDLSATRDLLPRLTAAAGPSTGIAFGSTVAATPDLDATSREWAAARELGLRIHAHVDPVTARPGAIAALAGAGLLGDDVTIVHPADLDEADLVALSGHGAAVSMTPSSEMAGGAGSPPIQQLIDRDIRPGLGIDDEWMAPGDMFAQMRETISLQHATVFDRKLSGKAGLPRLMTTRDVIRFATVDGARAAGVAGSAGSLAPGMQADVIVLRTDRPNVFPINDPIGAVVWGMDTSNVDRVFVAGRSLMREGVLEGDVERVRSLAIAARQRLAGASGLVGTATPAGAPAARGGA